MALSDKKPGPGETESLGMTAAVVAIGITVFGVFSRALCVSPPAIAAMVRPTKQTGFTNSPGTPSCW